MRLILMGTGPFAVPSFEAIRAHPYEIIQVITRPIVASPNKRESQTSPVRDWAHQHGLPLADPKSINEAATVDWLTSLRSDLLVVCDYGQILSKAALQASRLGGINLHGSLLPRHRGAAPVQWAILSGDAVSGVSVIHMTPALDGGPVLQYARLTVGERESAQQLESRLSSLGVNPTLESIAMLAKCDRLEQTTGMGEIQDRSRATKAPRLAKNDGELDFRFCVRHLDRLIRGLQPWPGTFTHLQFPDNKTVRILINQVEPIESERLPSGHVPGDLIFGELLEQVKKHEPKLKNSELAVAAGDGFLDIPMLQPAGKRMMGAAEFLRGYARYSHLKFAHANAENTLLQKISRLDS